MAGEMRVGANEIPRRKSLPRGQLMINGKWRDAGDGATMPTSDPTTEQVITEVAKGSAADLDKAVRAAASALRKILGPCCTMRLVPSFLFRMVDLLDDRTDEFALREAMDMGMPYRDSAISSCHTAQACFASLVDWR